MLVVLWWSVGCTTHTGAVGAQAPEPLDRDFSARADVVYTPSDWPEQLTGTVYRPAGPGPHPGVLLVHGGGWEGGQPSDMAFVAERLARRGYVTFNIGYRFAPEYTFPAQLHDVQQAVRWMRANAGTLRLDPGRIAGFGYSAGGHLITLAGMVGRGDPLDSPHGGPQTRLQAIVAGGTPTDLRKFEGGRLVPQFLGTTLQKNPRRYAQASPVTHVDPGDPPTFLYHGSWDGLVPVDHATDMNAALRRAGVPSELYIVNGLGHVPLFVFNRSSITAGIDFLDRVLRAP
jgi:acetyl esterase/lipase